jgi:hypothetical protein
VVVREDKKLLTVLFPDGRDGRAFTLKVLFFVLARICIGITDGIVTYLKLFCSGLKVPSVFRYNIHFFIFQGFLEYLTILCIVICFPIVKCEALPDNT